MPPRSKSPGFKAPFKSPFPYNGNPKKLPSTQPQATLKSSPGKFSHDASASSQAIGEQRVMKMIPTPAPHRLNQSQKDLIAPLDASTKKGKARVLSPSLDQTTQTPDSWKAVHDALWERVHQRKELTLVDFMVPEWKSHD